MAAMGTRLGRRLRPAKGSFMRIAALAALAALAAGCAGQGGTGGLSAAGDERGGKVPYSAGNMQAAMSAVRAHCAKFGKKSFITQMNPSGEGGLMAFECHSQ
jgi:ABC-type sugar transport system substrate-binding protein